MRVVVRVAIKIKVYNEQIRDRYLDIYMLLLIDQQEIFVTQETPAYLCRRTTMTRCCYAAET